MELKKLAISEKKRQALVTMGIDSVEALLTHYPFRYEVVEETPLSSWEKDGKVTLEGVRKGSNRCMR